MPTRLLLIAHAPTAATRRASFPLDEAIEEASAAVVFDDRIGLTIDDERDHERGRVSIDLAA